MSELQALGYRVMSVSEQEVLKALENLKAARQEGIDEYLRKYNKPKKRWVWRGWWWKRELGPAGTATMEEVLDKLNAAEAIFGAWHAWEVSEANWKDEQKLCQILALIRGTAPKSDPPLPRPQELFLDPTACSVLCEWIHWKSEATEETKF